MDEYSSSGFEDLFLLLIVVLFLAEIVIGSIQLLGALIRTVICLNNSQSIGKLKTYWLMVGVYFIVFFGLYFLEDYFMNNICIDNEMDIHLDDIRYYQYALYTQIIWVFLAWGIAIWYWIKIVFAKHKNAPVINNSITQ